MKKQKKDKNKKDRAYYLPVEDIWNRYDNKYEAITKIVEEVKRVSEIKGDSSDDSDIVVKVLKDLVESEAIDEKNSSGGNR